ncbi:MULTISPECIES: hypothetical protein [Capnocytophaga]|jgi:hypothetical protein|uniref:Uncharacterized protein n=3 Tax=Capnocytophaga TaxID=1016 RepID=A0ABS1YU80_9FLAO|nr:MULTISPECIES: hypothetical protein [Capnocytophaga]MBI1647970.1 hypothetical protein [Capnocytophaga periodontitidis]MBI1669710.1 hypothetical protein [Capnocytophaga periodontitidis]MBM0649580.1 hypothetical protein [Capnocytophaga genosp. AHN8471]MBM0652637.1 hypothetical protein [Capnocytophaga genosp. AHN8471]MBM0655789.1 hypothetical protein [Capnocytophaga genosp. AHN8471]
METLTIKPPKGVTLNDARIALERLNFEIVENQEYTISDSYKNELHDRLREWELSPETGISLDEARRLAYEKYGRI